MTRQNDREDDASTAEPAGLTTTAAASLDWEHFDFCDSPKWDGRFEEDEESASDLPDGDDGGDCDDGDGRDAGNRRKRRRRSLLRAVAADASDEEGFEEIRSSEAEKDAEAARRLDVGLRAWESLPPELVRRATEVLASYVNPDRVERIRSVLSERTGHTRFLFENPSNPSNVWACLRTLDSFGIQHVDVVIQSSKYKGKAAISQKRGMRTAMGSSKWLTLRNHPSTADAVSFLKEKGDSNSGKGGCRIYASDVNPQAADIRDIDWDGDDDDRPICIVMGNEESGISDEMRELADGTFYLPMCGFAESYNLSVATAITLAYLSAASSSSTSSSVDGQGSDGRRTMTGPIRPGDLPRHQLDCLLMKGLLNSVPQKRVAEAILRRDGIELPSEIMRLL